MPHVAGHIVTYRQPPKTYEATYDEDVGARVLRVSKAGSKHRNLLPRPLAPTM
jgi:hypothetical protein